jgi:hypothetical protein
MQYTGRVVRETIAKGSKSEHRAVLLDTGKEKYILRRPGENPFRDTALDKLVGKDISATGTVSGSTLFISDWSETDK